MPPEVFRTASLCLSKGRGPFWCSLSRRISRVSSLSLFPSRVIHPACNSIRVLATYKLTSHTMRFIIILVWFKFSRSYKSFQCFLNYSEKSQKKFRNSSKFFILFTKVYFILFHLNDFYYSVKTALVKIRRLKLRTRLYETIPISTNELISLGWSSIHRNLKKHIIVYNFYHFLEIIHLVRRIGWIRKTGIISNLFWSENLFQKTKLGEIRNFSFEIDINLSETSSHEILRLFFVTHATSWLDSYCNLNIKCCEK